MGMNPLVTSFFTCLVLHILDIYFPFVITFLICVAVLRVDNYISIHFLFSLCPMFLFCFPPFVM